MSGNEKPCPLGHLQCGSKYAPCCLLCPLPVCKDDARAAQHRERDAEMVALYRGGLGATEVGERYGMTRYAVYKALTRVEREERLTGG
jgi:DNA invertase Pin-like site-specific DNA recombinase